MYNGIGLQTPRGSGTNGYIQTNKFFVKPRPGGTAAGAGIPRPPKEGADEGPGIPKANKEILDHDRKRRIQVRLLVLEEALVDQGYTAKEIEERLVEAKEAYEAEAAAAADGNGGGGGDKRESSDSKRFSDVQTHQVALRKEKQSEIFRAALNISRDQPSEPELQQQNEQEKANDSESEGNDDKERQENERVSKVSHAREAHVLVDQDKEKSQRKKAPVEEPGSEDIQTKTEIGGRKDDYTKSKHSKKIDGRSREYSDSESDSSRRKDGKSKKEHRKSSRGDSSEDDSDINGKKTKHVTSRRKSSKKCYSSSSDSDVDSDSENANRKYAKPHRRHDSDSDSERNTRDQKQVGKHMKRQRHGSEDSASDVEKKGNEVLRKKQMGKQKCSRRPHSESSEADTDTERRSLGSKDKRQLQNQKSRGRYDSEDSDSDAVAERRRKGNLVEKHTKHRANKDEESEIGVGGNKKNSGSRIEKHGKSRSSSEESGSDSSDSASSTDSDSSDSSQDGCVRSERREDGARTSQARGSKMEQRPELKEHMSSYRSSRSDNLERDYRNNVNEDILKNGKLGAARRTEGNERFMSKKGFDEDDYVKQETRKRTRYDDEPPKSRSMDFEASERKKRKESRGEDSSGLRDYSRSREDRKKEEYYSSDKLEEKWDIKGQYKRGTESRNSDRDAQDDGLLKRRRLGDRSQHQREEMAKHTRADSERHRRDHSWQQREERYERNHGVDAHYDRHNSNLFRHHREERHKSSHDGDPGRDQYKYRHSQHQREERREHRHDDTGHSDRHRGR